VQVAGQDHEVVDVGERSGQVGALGLVAVLLVGRVLDPRAGRGRAPRRVGVGGLVGGVGAPAASDIAPRGCACERL
jgi:hypothetical protein